MHSRRDSCTRSVPCNFCCCRCYRAVLLLNSRRKHPIILHHGADEWWRQRKKTPSLRMTPSNPGINCLALMFLVALSRSCCSGAQLFFLHPGVCYLLLSSPFPYDTNLRWEVTFRARRYHVRKLAGRLLMHFDNMFVFFFFCSVD